MSAVNYFKPTSISRIWKGVGIGIGWYDGRMVGFWNTFIYWPSWAASIFLLTFILACTKSKLRKSKQKCNEKQNGKQNKVRKNIKLILVMVLGKQGIRSHSTNETENKHLNCRQILSYH